jgi:hypothetical protein
MTPMDIPQRGNCGTADYLLGSNKIILNDHEIVWVFPDNAKLRKLLQTSHRVL